MRTRIVVGAIALSASLVLGTALTVLAAPTTVRISLSTANAQGNGSSIRSAISNNGRFLAFESVASNLIGNDNNNAQDIFFRNRKSGKTSRISKRSNGAEANGLSQLPFISDSGRFVAFSSDATNLIGQDGNNVSDVFVKQLQLPVDDLVQRSLCRVLVRSRQPRSQ